MGFSSCRSQRWLKLMWFFPHLQGHPDSTFYHSDAYCTIYPHPNNTASVRRDEHELHQCPGWGLCVAAVTYNDCLTYTTIGIYMMCVVMAVNSWIVAFHSSVIKFGQFGEFQKATFTDWSVIFTAYCGTSPFTSHKSPVLSVFLLLLLLCNWKEENIT